MRLANNRLVGLIGWFSVCVLAAAWGPIVEAGWRHVWSALGLFGLVSAVGLEAAQRLRLSQEQKRSQDRASLRCESAMDEIVRQNKATAAVKRAIRRIAEFAARQQVPLPEVDLEDKIDEQVDADRRSERRARCILPVEILVGDGEGRYVLWNKDDSRVAYIRDVSPSGVGLVHNEPVDDERVVLRIALEDAECILLSVCVMWCRPIKEGWFTSGGKVTEVLAVGKTAPSTSGTSQSFALRPQSETAAEDA